MPPRRFHGRATSAFVTACAIFAMLAAASVAPAVPRDAEQDDEPPTSPLDMVDVDEPQAVLTVDRPYHHVGRPVNVTIAGRVAELGETVEIAIMNAEGIMLVPPAVVPTGEVDLREYVTDFDTLDEPAYVQTLIDQRAVGSPLVIQPLVTPPRPIIEQHTLPDGSVIKRVVGWSDELPDRDERAGSESDEEPDKESEAESASETESNQSESDDGSSPRTPVGETDTQIRAGFRLDPHVDIALDTTLGPIRIALRPDAAPNTARHVRDLVNARFYDGVEFHRVIPMRRDGRPFIIQTGDPTATGAGGPGMRLPLERSALEHDLGVVSMARGDEPDSAGSQFFICLSRDGTQHLDGQYCAFAEVVEGLETINAIADVPLEDVAAGRPADPPVIRRATLVPAPPIIPGQGRPDQRITRPEPEDESESQPERVPR